jgi:hypothetical protein
MCPVYFVNHVTGLYLTLALSLREREGVRVLLDGNMPMA